MNFKDILYGIFDEGTEEYEQISECYDLIAKTAPTIAAEAKTHLLLLDHARINLSTIYFMLCRNISKKREIYQQAYDTQYARLVKLGRPSNAAIEAEIRSTNSDYAVLSRQIESLEQVKDLITAYVRCIDASKQTTFECLRDSRRLD